MRSFFMSYSGNEKLAPMVREIGWTHNILIMERCHDVRQREFYIRMTGKFGWTKDVLAIRFQDQNYEKTLLGQNNFEKTLLGRAVKGMLGWLFRGVLWPQLMGILSPSTPRE
jgi:predicted nuclease of restriction endonuclease-like (RecB) superfamily